MQKNYSYVSLLTDDTYTYGVILLAETLKQVNSQYPLHILVTKNVSESCLEILNELDNVSYEFVENITISQNIIEHNKALDNRLATIWTDTWTKLRIFDLTKFDKIIFLDSDIMVFKNLDHLFEKPHFTAAVDGEYFNLWSDDIHFNAGCLVIEPNHEYFEFLVNFINNEENLKDSYFDNKIIADQEILNFLNQDWGKKEELHLNKYYNIFGPYTQDEQIDDLKENGYFIHFIGRKPWTFWVHNPAEHYSEAFYDMAKEIINKKIVELDWQLIRSKNILTVYAICKNEMKNIEKWLKGFGKADYVCILDTGSTDGTWEFLQEETKKRPNLITKQEIINPWRFDTARNISMTLIPKETTIFFMADIDEEIHEDDWVEKVKSIWEPNFNRGAYCYNRDVAADGTITKQITEYRIHSKQWTHWKNIVHEAIYNIFDQKNFYAENCTKVDITVWHFPTKGPTNYVELCEEDLIENPNDFIMRLQLAIEYEIRKNNDKAMEHFQYIIQKGPNMVQPFELARCFYGIGRILMYDKQDIANALNYFREGRLIAPYYADNYFGAIEFYINNKDFKTANDLCEAAFSNCLEALWCSVFDIKAYYTFYYAGICSYALGEKIKSLGYLVLAIEKNPEFKDAKNLYENLKNELYSTLTKAL